MDLQQVVKDNNLQIDLVDFAVNEWGSCQYSGALDFFNIMVAMEEKYGRTEALNRVGIKLTAVLVDDIEKAVNEFIDGIKEDLDPTDEFDQNSIAELNDIKDKTCFDDLFEWSKNQARDLWSAAPCIIPYGFKELEFKGIEDAPGVGPVLNIMVQLENYEVGFYCWLAKSYGLIKDEDSFADFDT